MLVTDCTRWLQFVRNGLLGFVLLSSMVLWDGRASAVAIDFDTLPDGSTPTLFADVGNAYASLGVVFGTAEANDPGAPDFRTVSGPGFPGPSIGVGDFARDAGDNVGFHILADFVAPVLSVSFDSFSASPIEFTVIATAFDVNGNLLGSVESTLIFGTYKGNYTFEGIGEISSVLWTGNVPSLAAAISIDNLTFSVVPEPNTAVLFGLGIGLLGVRKQRTASLAARPRARIAR